jgi:hypothetical protein
VKTIRRLIYGEVLASIALVAVGFLALFFFFDLVDELQYLGKNNGLTSANDIYQIRHALLYVGLLVPNHLYELLPISVLIGSRKSRPTTPMLRMSGPSCLATKCAVSRYLNSTARGWQFR